MKRTDKIKTKFEILRVRKKACTFTKQRQIDKNELKSEEGGWERERYWITVYKCNHILLFSHKSYKVYELLVVLRLATWFTFNNKNASNSLIKTLLKAVNVHVFMRFQRLLLVRAKSLAVINEKYVLAMFVASHFLIISILN